MLEWNCDISVRVINQRPSAPVVDVFAYAKTSATYESTRSALSV
jgi:hypothetical protein